ncbi:MAG: rhodanese-like domain-containing protein, partial [Spirochaetaceae bacterium]|nr:rhodanese-like domain-containing protein [Spirochaetaceae bacterium]
IMVIDVRPFNAYEKGHLPGAVSMPSSEIKKSSFEIDKNQDVILYCETGGRAQQVIKYLEEEGYTRLMNWGGYTRWKWDYTKGVYP